MLALLKLLWIMCSASAPAAPSQNTGTWNVQQSYRVYACTCQALRQQVAHLHHSSCIRYQGDSTRPQPHVLSDGGTVQEQVQALNKQGMTGNTAHQEELLQHERTNER